MAKKRSVNRFVLGCLASGLIVTALGFGGKIGFEARHEKLLDRLDSAENNLDTKIEELIGGEYERYIEEQRLYLNAQIMLGNMEPEEYSKIAGNFYKQETKINYIKNNYEPAYNNQILPLEQEVATCKRKIENNEKLVPICGAAAILGATGVVFSTAAYIAGREKEL